MRAQEPMCRFQHTPGVSSEGKRPSGAARGTRHVAVSTHPRSLLRGKEWWDADDASTYPWFQHTPGVSSEGKPTDPPMSPSQPARFNTPPESPPRESDPHACREAR